MKNIVILDNHNEARHLYTMNLQAYTAATVHEFESLDKAIFYIDNHTPDLIITRSRIDSRDAAKKVAELLVQKKLTTPLIVIGETTVNFYQASIYKEPVDLKEVIKKAAQLLGVTASDMANIQVDEYYAIPLKLILAGFELVCPIFKKVDNEFKKVLERNHKMHQEVLVILHSEGVEEIYVRSIERLRFISSFSVQMSDILRNDNIALEEKLKASDIGHQMMRECAKRMMIDSETMQLADASIDTMLSISSTIPKLKDLLDLTMKDSMSLLYQHCLLTSYVCAHIIKNMKWGTREQQVKATFVSFFHDIALTSDDHLIYHSDDELKTSHLSPEEKKSVSTHALRAAQFLSKYHNRIPLGADTIIKQHHGSRDGIGLSKISQNISPLAIVFIIAEEWVSVALKHQRVEGRIHRTKIINFIKNKYKLPAFKPVIAVLKKLAI